MKLKRLGFLLAVLLGCTISLAADTERLSVITPHNTQIQGEFEAAFKRAVGRPIEIRWIKQGTGELMQLLAAKDRTDPKGGFDLDVFFGGGIGDHELAAQRGYLEKPQIDKAVIDAIPAEVAGSLNRDPEGLWIGNALSAFGILVNKKVLEAQHLPKIETWEDLTRSEYYGWVILCDPRKSASVTVPYEAILQHYGWERGWAILTMMAGNARQFTSASSEIPNEIATANAAAGPAVDFYAYARIEQLGISTLDYVLPRGATAITADPISLLRKPSNPRLANEFITFVLSTKGQRLWIRTPGQEDGPTQHALYRAPILPSAYEGLGEGTFVKNLYEEARAGHLLALDADLHARRSALLGEVMGATLVDMHQELRQTWQAIIKAGRPAAAIEKLTAVPFPLADTNKLADQIDKDPSARRQLKRQWATDLERRLSDVSAGLR